MSIILSQCTSEISREKSLKHEISVGVVKFLDFYSLVRC